MCARVVHVNGRIVPADEAKVSVADVAFLHGASAFTTMLAHNGVVFRLDRHLERLLATTRLLGFVTDATAEHLAAATRDLLQAAELVEARVRVTLSPGGTDGAGATTVVSADPLPDYPRQWYEQGITVTVSSFRQAMGSPIDGHKTGCYLPRVLARQEAAAKGGDEALWFTLDNRLAEACFCNVFLVSQGHVRTPPVATPVLPGIVREAVMQLCKPLGLACGDAEPLTIRDVLGADEMFLTSSCAGIRPIARVERHAVGAEKPGPVTTRLAAAYRELLDRECTS